MSTTDAPSITAATITSTSIIYFSTSHPLRCSRRAPRYAGWLEIGLPGQRLTRRASGRWARKYRDLLAFYVRYRICPSAPGMWRCGLALVFSAAVLAVAAPGAAQTRKLTSAVYVTTAEPRGDDRLYSQLIAKAARRYAVPESLVWAMIRAESGFDHRAVSRKGARGLMQLMPQTAAILGVRNPLDPHQNIDGGVRHLRAMIDRFRNDLLLAVAAYNAGEKAVVEYGGVPPFRETQEYVSRVMRFYSTAVIVIDLPQGVHVVERDGTIVYTNIAPQGRPYRLGG